MTVLSEKEKLLLYFPFFPVARPFPSMLTTALDFHNNLKYCAHISCLCEVMTFFVTNHACHKNIILYTYNIIYYGINIIYINVKSFCA